MSEVWNHFFMASNGLSVTCNHCGKFMKRSDSSTKSMWGHLKAFHADLVGEETFRLKRTRRMRGEGGGTKTKMASAKAKAGEGKGATNGTKGRKKTNPADELMAPSNSSVGSSFSSASSSSGGEEMDELEDSVECSSRASSQEEADRTSAELEEAKEAEEERRKSNAISPMADEAAETRAEEQKTPTQPYVKRKRQKERQPSECAAEESPLYVPLVAAVSQQNAVVEQLQQQLHSRAALSSSPAVPSFGCAVPSSANAIPCSALASSAFSKYSTAALLMENGSAGGGCSVGTASPSHAAEAPKQCFRSAEGQHSQQQQSHPLPAPRPKYGMEALSGMDNSPLAMTAGVADSAMFANLDAAVAMNHLLTEYQHQQQKNGSNNVQSMHQNVQQKLAYNRNGHAQQQMNGQQLNELLAIYAASALQQQQQKSTDPQQQQLAAQQAAAAVSWLYNWEWMTAAAAATSKPTQQQKAVNNLNLMPGGTTPTKVNKGTPNERRTAVGGSSNSNNGNALNMLMSAGIPLLSALSLGGIGTGNNGTAEIAQRNCEEMKPKQQQTNPNKQQTQKRKSPAEERDCAASLLALADRAATDPSQRGGPSPPKNRKMGEHCEKQSQDNQNGEGNAANGLADGASEALAESLVLYGMHRIAMELQLSYYVHGNKAGRAEYAFYCSNTDGNANVQRMVTLTESADQLLHIREHANGTVVAEECWPKNAEPGTLLLSLRDKCQRRLCA
ncbi:hypothetical protein niasHT_036787 [Heterodera trifolii]|uniref:BED-type domain-containing protein n=1 Tax=Heterodera trifolii TaxID=157864 RepID=A0ABD2IV12_9BILA